MYVDTRDKGIIINLRIIGKEIKSTIEKVKFEIKIKNFL